MLTSRLPKKSATILYRQNSFKSPTVKGRNRHIILRSFRKFKYVIFCIIPLLLLILVFTIENVFSPFSIVKVNTNGFPFTDIDKSLVIGKKLYFINEKVINDLLLPNHIEINNFKIVKKYPDTLDISAFKRTGIFRIKNDKQYFILDKDGVVFQSVTSSKLTDFPVKINNIAVGTIIDKQDLTLYSEVVDSLKGLNLSIDSIYLQGEFIYVDIKDKYKIKFNITSYMQEIKMLKNVVVGLDPKEKIKEISFVDNKVLIQY